MMHRKYLKQRLLQSAGAILILGTASVPVFTSSTLSRANQAASVVSQQKPAPSGQTLYRTPALGLGEANPDSFQFGYSRKAFVVDVAQRLPKDSSLLNAIDIWTQQDYQSIEAGDYEGGTEYPANVRVSVHRNPQNVSVQQWVKQSNQFVAPSHFKQRAIAGQKGVLFSSTGLYENENVVFSNPKSGNIILISLAKVNYGDSDAMYRTAFNEVMNSFAFTKAEPSSTAKESFIVRGNEPFWNVTVNKSNIVYSTPETPKLTFPSVAPLGAEGRPADNVRVYRLQGQPSGFLIINKGACSDTMSDQAYAYSATLILGNVVREGCAVKQ